MDGTANITALTGEVSALCYNGVWYNVDTCEEASERGGQGAGAVVLWSLFATTLLALIAVVATFFISLVVRRKRKRGHSIRLTE